MNSYASHLSAQMGTLISNSQDVEFCLFPDEVFKMQADSRGVQIVCQKGRLWITQATDPQDYVLMAGDKFVVTRPGVVLIQGVREGRARLIQPMPLRS